MKTVIYFFLTVATVVACNNGKVEKQQPGTNNIARSKNDTARLSNFPGTSIYIQLPNGFAWNETAMSFYKEEDGSVIKYDEFKTMRFAANMPVEEMFGSPTNRQPITVSGYKGEIKTYQQGSTGIVLELSFGDDTFMKFIEASYFSHQKETEKDVLNALKSIQVKNK